MEEKWEAVVFNAQGVVVFRQTFNSSFMANSWAKSVCTGEGWTYQVYLTR